MEESLQNKNITQNFGGLNQDSSPINQDKKKIRFALNAVNETEKGDVFFKSIEEGNQICATLRAGYTPIGKIYMPDSRVVIFSTNNYISEIGILYDNCKYVEIVNDATSTNKLGFNVTKQIEGIYRLRKGCEDTIYFVGKGYKPRYFNFNKIADFKDNLGDWDANKFNLIKTYNSIPKFEKIEVVEQNGNLLPGSINVYFQYVDNSLNPTQWIIGSKVANIYNDAFNNVTSLRNVNGSVNQPTFAPLNFGNTNKALNVKFLPNTLDRSYPFYRLAFVEANVGTGKPNSIKYSEIIPIEQNEFTFTGNNFSTIGTLEELSQIQVDIDEAGSIEQIENRLLLANIKGKQIEYCKLQKYASKIAADCVLKQINITSNSNTNPKSPIVQIGDMITGSVGYMPGEMYAFGIVYVFEDGTESPVYHIPGKSHLLPENHVFTNGSFPMGLKNELESTTYIDNSSCTDFWGKDIMGTSLKNQKVRHHRFPHRINYELDGDTVEFGLNEPLVNINRPGTVGNSVAQSKLSFIANLNDLVLDNNPLTIIVKYCALGIERLQSHTFIPTATVAAISLETDFFINPPNTNAGDVFSGCIGGFDVYEIKVYDENNIDVTATYSPTITYPNPRYTSKANYNSVDNHGNVTSKIFGIKFSNITIPTETEIGAKIVGYYIVRAERKDEDKTVVDNAVLTPTILSGNFIAQGLLQPVMEAMTPLNHRPYKGFIAPENKFLNKQLSFDKILLQGIYYKDDVNYSNVRVLDVMEGTSYNEDEHKDINDDGDKAKNLSSRLENKVLPNGWAISIAFRDTFLQFMKPSLQPIAINPVGMWQRTSIKSIFYLDPLSSQNVTDNGTPRTVNNVASNNSTGIVEFENSAGLGGIYEEGINSPETNGQPAIPYVSLLKNVSNPYSDFNTRPFYKDSLNIETGTTSTLFSGDTYISSMKYQNTVFYDNQIAKRIPKTGAWRIILGIFIVLAAITALVLSGGIAAPIVGAIGVKGVLFIAGVGILTTSSGIKKAASNRIYNELYNQGLRETVFDRWVQTEFGKLPDWSVWSGLISNGYKTKIESPSKAHGKDSSSDDEIQWYSDCLTNLYFESTINMSLRNRFKDGTNAFINAPGIFETGNSTGETFATISSNGLTRYRLSLQRNQNLSELENHVLNLLTRVSDTRIYGRIYNGISYEEYYNINLDYLRYDRERFHFALGFQYDCCSDCKETFPHRIFYSEQSFQEEISDNYRVFLPLNYKDIEGETGEIMNLFKLNNDLFVHTLEALWNLPRNHQERITDQIVSFIGTGSFFEIPPRKILDDETGNSAGTQHKWGFIKTPIGYFFITENQNKMYLFNGQLKAINNDINSWFKNNIKSLGNTSYYQANDRDYPYRDNPSNPFGFGYIMTYDSRLERIIVTKKDFTFNSELTLANSYIHYCNGNMIIFNNYSSIIQTWKLLGYTYVGIVDCKMKFIKEIVEEVELPTFEIGTSVVNEKNIVVVIDNSLPALEKTALRNYYIDWYNNVGSLSPTWTGNLYFVLHTDDYASQRYLRHLNYIINSIHTFDKDLNPVTIPTNKDIIILSHIQEIKPTVEDGYFTEGISYANPVLLGDYTSDRALFISDKATLEVEIEQFIYPSIINTTNSKTMAQHLLNVVRPLTVFEIDNLFILGLTSAETDIIKSNLYTSVYDTLSNIYGVQTDFTSINNDKLQALIDKIAGLITTGTFTTIVEDNLDIVEVTGVQITRTIENNNSWTLSYSLKEMDWISFHSYLPNFYINTPEKFYSWISGNNNVWQHNIKGLYRTYYTIIKPFILEYVSLPNLIENNIFEDIKYISQVEIYDVTTNSYYTIDNKTFNKFIAYNSNQTTGLTNLVLKSKTSSNYLPSQTQNTPGQAFVSNNEKDWFINQIRDYRSNYSQPIFFETLGAKQSEYFIDKVLNTGAIDFNKSWFNLENLRDKYLIVRLIFDTNENNVKFVVNFNIDTNTKSLR